MVNIKDKTDVKPFVFKIYDSIIEKDYKNRLYNRCSISYWGDISLGMNGDTLFCKDGHFNDVFNFNNNAQITSYPIGGMLMIRDSVVYDKEKRSSIYYFSLEDYDTQDIDFGGRSEEIEILKMKVSKEYGFIEFLIKDNETGNIYRAKSD